MGISSWVKPFLIAFILQSCPTTMEISVQSFLGFFLTVSLHVLSSKTGMGYVAVLHLTCIPGIIMLFHEVRLSDLYPQWQEKMVLCCCSGEKAKDRWVKYTAHSSEIAGVSVWIYFHIFLNRSLSFYCMIALQVLVITAGATLKSTFLKSMN